MNELEKTFKENRRGRLGNKGTIQVRNGDRRLGQGLGTNRWKIKTCQFNRVPLLS